MPLRDFGLVFAICLVWGLNIVFTRAIVMQSPPLFYAFVRFALVTLALSPLLFTRPVPKQFWTLVAIGQCMGGANFALSFMALKFGTASSFAVVSQLGLPVTTLFSMWFLQERVGWIRAAGMALAFLGVIVVAYRPTGLEISIGMVFTLGMVLIGAAGAVLMKRMDPMPVFQMQVWVAMVSWPLLLVLSGLFERSQIAETVAVGWPYVAALAFSVFCVSMFGHGMFYSLVKRHEITLLAPLTLMTPLWAVFFSVTLLGEPVSAQLLLGGAIALAGVAIVAMRRNQNMPEPPATPRA
ncbi:MAG: EamA family transporter [Alphaproteobacteria bacterium]|nr:EamA family transporter [Alphaproteobacteria bacterium]